MLVGQPAGRLRHRCGRGARDLRLIRRLTTSICPLSHTEYIKSLFLKKISLVFGCESSDEMAQKLPELKGVHRLKSIVLAEPRLCITNTFTAHMNSIIRCLNCKK